MSPELDRALRQLARSMQIDLSRLVETLLREHPLVDREVNAQRNRGPSTKKGRHVAKILALAEVARAQWDARIRRGEVKLLDG